MSNKEIQGQTLLIKYAPYSRRKLGFLSKTFGGRDLSWLFCRNLKIIIIIITNNNNNNNNNNKDIYIYIIAVYINIYSCLNSCLYIHI